MGRPHDACRAVDRGAEEIVVARVHGAAMQAAAHAQGEASRSRRIEQRELDVDHRAEPVSRRRESGVDPVAGSLHDAPAVALDSVAQQHVVPCDGLRHLHGLRFPQRGAALDVGEQKGQYGRGLVH